MRAAELSLKRPRTLEAEAEGYVALWLRLQSAEAERNEAQEAVVALDAAAAQAAAERDEALARELKVRRELKATLQAELEALQEEHSSLTEKHASMLSEVGGLRSEALEAQRASGQPAALAALDADALAQLEARVGEALERIRTARAERQRARTECVVCRDRVRTELFLPCRHLVCCAECTAALRSSGDGRGLFGCPACRGVVAETHSVLL